MEWTGRSGQFYNVAVSVDAIVDTTETASAVIIGSFRHLGVDDAIKIGIAAVGQPVEGSLSYTMYDWNFPRPFQNEISTPRAREMYEIERNMREADASYRAARKARRSARRRIGTR